MDIKIKITALFLIAGFILPCCKKTDIVVDVKILGHRGLVNDTIKQNTLRSVAAAWNMADGAETDIQRDADGEIWLFHDGSYINCDGEETCFPKTAWEQIEKEMECGALKEIIMLEDIFAYHRDNDLNKIISLDVKTWYNKSCFEQQGADEEFLDNEIDALYGLIINYDMANNVLIETDSKYFLDKFKSKELDVKTFLLGYDNFEEQIKIALKRDYSGLSHDWRDPEVTKENIQYARRKGLLIQLWTPNAEDDLRKVYELNPDYIQTDNLKFAMDSLKNKRMSKGKEAKPHIGIYGRRNNGKSSLINKLAGQDIAIVSDFAGTTTDPVKKSFEITGFGPVILIDTAGIDDVGELGGKRIEKTLKSIKTVDLAILVITQNTFGKFEQDLITEFKKTDTPFFIIHNKSDVEKLDDITKRALFDKTEAKILEFSTIQENNIDHVVDTIKQVIPESSYKNPSLVGDLISYGDIVLLITPIDIEAPAGRLILPQVQAIRDILDNDAVAIVVKEREVDAFLRKTGIKPALAITDSQIFTKADASIPREVPLTSFSIVLARLKGDFDNYIQGTPKISELKDGDRVLLLESCTHHVSCDDIGRIKIPRWLSNFTGKKLEYDVVAGLDNLPRAITDYSLVVQCGGCVITRKQLTNRLRPAIDAGVPVTNYGMAIAYVQGIYERAVAPFLKTSESSLDYL